MLCAFQSWVLSVPLFVVSMKSWGGKKKLITCGLYRSFIWKFHKFNFLAFYFDLLQHQVQTAILRDLRLVEERMKNNYRLEMFWHAAQWMLIFCMFFPLLLFLLPRFLEKMIISVVFDHDELISSVRKEERDNEGRRKRKSRF